jgi:inorganic pyrophosphatase
MMKNNGMRVQQHSATLLPPGAAVAFPVELEVVVEVPRGGFIKRNDAGGVDFVSPLPCPFNYGSVPDSASGDGDRLDVVLLGPRLARGTRVRAKVVARVSFTDAGLDDPKMICAFGALGPGDRVRIRAFFWCYAHAKTLLNAARGKPGHTRYGGLEECVEP